MDPTLAFATLLASRMVELALSTDDVADGVDVSGALVDEWIAGETSPEDEKVEPLARVLSLPRSLVWEACRRAHITRQSPDPIVEDSSAVAAADAPLTDATHHQPVPSVVMPAVVVDPRFPPDAVSRSVEMLGSLWRLLRDRLDRGRERARAATGELSYFEDSQQRMTYQLRAVFTVGGVTAMVIVLRWAFSGFNSALTDLWAELTGAL